jgi:hypothetical protein
MQNALERPRIFQIVPDVGWQKPEGMVKVRGSRKEKDPILAHDQILTIV